MNPKGENPGKCQNYACLLLPESASRENYYKNGGGVSKVWLALLELFSW